MTLLNIGANYPMIMLPIMEQNRMKAMFFIVFILFHNLFIAKLFLGVIYINYKELLFKQTKEHLKNKLIYSSIF